MHVLSLPPAFVLSQDQTLKLNLKHLKPAWSRLTRSGAPKPPHDGQAPAYVQNASDSICLSFTAEAIKPPPARTTPPAFLFLQYINLSKNDEDRDPHTLMGRTENTPDQNPGRRSYHHRSETPALSEDRGVPVAGERHIGRASRACQRRCDRKMEIPANEGNRRFSPGPSPDIGPFRVSWI